MRDTKEVILQGPFLVREKKKGDQDQEILKEFCLCRRNKQFILKL